MRPHEKNRVPWVPQALLYNAIRPHASLGYKPPAPEVFVPASPRGRCATSIGSPATAGAQTNLKLTCQLDHSVGADQGGKKNLNCYCAAGRKQRPAIFVGLTNQRKCDETYRWLLCR